MRVRRERQHQQQSGLHAKFAQRSMQPQACTRRKKVKGSESRTTKRPSLSLAARLTKVWLECRKGGCDLFRDRMPQMRLGKVSISGPNLADLRATDKSDTPGRAVSTQNTRAPQLSTQIQIGCAPDRAGGRNLSRSCASVCPNRKHTPPAHATMLAMREHSIVSPWWHGSFDPMGVEPPHLRTPDLLYSHVTLWAPHKQ